MPKPANPIPNFCITEPALIAKHRELFHYTRPGGFDGILNSQQLWATHYKNLNDTTEVLHLKEPLRCGLATRFAAYLHERQKRSMVFSLKVIDHGGRDKVADGLATSMTNSLYTATYGSRPSLQFGAPYITSFTTHSNEYDAQHGLLSQWRDYGRDGYCLVFDTKILGGMLQTDFDAFYMVHLNLDEVVYSVGEFDIEHQFGDLMRRCEQYLDAVLATGSAPEMIENGFAPFAAATTLFKHQGFREENEVRIVAIPGTQALSDATKAAFPAQFVERPIMEPVEVGEGKGARWHVSLFSKTGRDLPLKRVIVCPGPEQQVRFDYAQERVGGKAEVTKSAIPWTG